jgi:flagellar biosynthesis GTPase FlhF
MGFATVLRACAHPQPQERRRAARQRRKKQQQQRQQTRKQTQTQKQKQHAAAAPATEAIARAVAAVAAAAAEAEARAAAAVAAAQVKRLQKQKQQQQRQQRKKKKRTGASRLGFCCSVKSQQHLSVGDLCEVKIISGSSKGDWATCRLTSEGDTAGTFNIHIFANSEAKPGSARNVDVRHLRRSEHSWCKKGAFAKVDGRVGVVIMGPDNDGDVKLRYSDGSESYWYLNIMRELTRATGAESTEFARQKLQQGTSSEQQGTSSGQHRTKVGEVVEREWTAREWTAGGTLGGVANPYSEYGTYHYSTVA